MPASSPHDPHRSRSTSPEGVEYRDLNGNGRMDRYEDPRLDPASRVEDLLTRLSLEEKVGLMFQTVIEAGEDGSVLERPGRISKSPTSVVVLEKHLSHFNVHALDDARAAARWHNEAGWVRRDFPSRLHPNCWMNSPMASGWWSLHR